MNDAVLRGRKDAAIDELTARFSRGGLSMEEYERLAGDVNAAADAAALAVVEDIIGVGRTNIGTGHGANAVGHTPFVGPHDLSGQGASGVPPQFLGDDQVQSSYAVLSSRRLSGNWLRKPNAAAVTVLGEQVIDMRDVELPPGRTVLELFVLLGSVTILVPSDLPVVLELIPVAGDASVGRSVDTRERSGAPSLVLSGTVVLGSVVVKQR